ncbi:MAG: ester cyclase [Acidobacteria bacterium]|nr:MAG: ester cyclase [Acidobacteriota bacterium]REJ98028.1 MAG: ester cyclase [Acidobacteriota bacterium]REK16771.1 MAG: ester cyclase [Acidobacteriota bacterium]REK42682.1 MAG: ester cyclase [Acidobacteriota bacterium]
MSGTSKESNMGLEDNKAVARRIYEEVLNGRNIDLADELVAEDSVENDPFPGVGQGRKGFKQFWKMFEASFPDYRISIEDIIAEGDKVVLRIRVKADYTGEPFIGTVPTGREIEFESIDILRIENGVVTEHWGETDAIAMFDQIGAVELAIEV